VAPPVEPSRVRKRSWKGDDVTLADVLEHLNRLHSELAHHDAGPGDHPHPRNITLNLVVVTGDDAGMAAAADHIAETVASQHPLRAIVIHDDLSGRDRIDAEVDSHAAVLIVGAPVQREQILLNVSGEPGRHLPSLLEPLLAPDVPTYLWWLGTPPLGEVPIEQALEMVDVLVVDSAGFETPFTALLDLADLARTLPKEVGIADLAWERLRPWREALGQFFAPTERHGFLDGLNGVGIDYAGEGRGNRIGAVLMAGWLEATLHWKLRRAASGQGGIVVAYLDSPRQHPVEMAFRSIRADAMPGELEAIRLEGASGGRTFAVTMQRDSEKRTLADVKIDIGGVDSVRQVISLPKSDSGLLLLRATRGLGIAGMRERALLVGGELLSATR